MFVLISFGGSWDTVFAQGTVPDVPPTVIPTPDTEFFLFAEQIPVTGQNVTEQEGCCCCCHTELFLSKDVYNVIAFGLILLAITVVISTVLNVMKTKS